MTEGQREVQHMEPVWRDRRNFIIAAELAEGSAASREQLSARRLSDSEFELCCIPFFLYDVALGDVVETDVEGPRRYLIGRVVRPSGRYVFRAYFDQSMLDNRADVVAQLTELGALLEWSSASLLAVDARDFTHAQEIADFLSAQENGGRLLYESGKSA